MFPPKKYKVSEDEYQLFSFSLVFPPKESFFMWTFGVELPGFYGAVAVDTGKTVLFAPKIPESYIVYVGK